MEVIKFSAPWCGPCRAMAPHFEQVKDRFPDVTFTEIDIDEQEDAAASHGVQSVPTVIIIKDDKEVDRFIGFRPAEFIENFISEKL